MEGQALDNEDSMTKEEEVGLGVVAFFLVDLCLERRVSE
jgi:hypothetical protein